MTDKIKVLWFTNTPSSSDEFVENEKRVYGGWIRSLESQIVKLENISLGVCFIGKGETEQFKVNDVSFFKVEYNATLFWQLWGKADVHLVQRFIQVINDFEPDIIHIHGTELPYGLITSQIEVPVVISIQGNLTVLNKMYFRGGFQNVLLNFRALVIQPKATIAQFLAYLSIKKSAKRERTIINQNKYFIGRTFWDKMVVKSIHLNSRYFYGGEILREVFYTKQYQKHSNKKIIIVSTLGNSLYKGLESIIETALILEDNYKLDFEWRIIGLNEGDTSVRFILANMKYKLSRNIRLIGRLPEGKLVDELMGANLYVHPSHIENSSNSICEAQIIGLPVVASYAGGTESLITHHYDGLLVQDGDPWFLSGSIIELLTNEKLFLKISRNSRENALKRHSREIIVKGLRKVYDEILEINKENIS